MCLAEEAAAFTQCPLSSLWEGTQGERWVSKTQKKHDALSPRPAKSESRGRRGARVDTRVSSFKIISKIAFWRPGGNRETLFPGEHKDISGKLAQTTGFWRS